MDNKVLNEVKVIAHVHDCRIFQGNRKTDGTPWSLCMIRTSINKTAKNSFYITMKVWGDGSENIVLNRGDIILVTGNLDYNFREKGDPKGMGEHFINVKTIELVKQTEAVYGNPTMDEVPF